MDMLQVTRVAASGDSAALQSVAEQKVAYYAASPIPACGLIQIVPVSAGRDARRELKNEDGIPDKNYLHQANNIIEVGRAYVHTR